MQCPQGKKPHVAIRGFIPIVLVLLSMSAHADVYIGAGVASGRLSPEGAVGAYVAQPSDSSGLPVVLLLSVRPLCQ